VQWKGLPADVFDRVRRVNGNATLQCPIKEDSYSIVQSVDLPEEIPRGKPPSFTSTID
jgi:hypothetical protein